MRGQCAGLALTAERPDGVESLGNGDPQSPLHRGPRHVGQFGNASLVTFGAVLEPLEPRIDFLEFDVAAVATRNRSTTLLLPTHQATAVGTRRLMSATFTTSFTTRHDTIA